MFTSWLQDYSSNQGESGISKSWIVKFHIQILNLMFLTSWSSVSGVEKPISMHCLLPNCTMHEGSHFLQWIKYQAAFRAWPAKSVLYATLSVVGGNLKWTQLQFQNTGNAGSSDVVVSSRQLATNKLSVTNLLIELGQENSCEQNRSAAATG